MTNSRLTLKQACTTTGLSKRNLYQRASRDRTFPVMIKIPSKGIEFERAEIEAWARANPPPVSGGAA